MAPWVETLVIALLQYCLRMLPTYFSRETNRAGHSNPGHLDHTQEELIYKNLKASGHPAKRPPQLTFLFCELVKQTRLSDAHVADDDVFEDVGVVVRSGSHFGTWKGERDKSFSQIDSSSTKMNRT